VNKRVVAFLTSLFFTVLLFSASAMANTASDLILQEAHNEATQLEAVRSALLLDYSDNYNQYLTDYKNWLTTGSGSEPTEPLIGRNSSGSLSWSGALSYLPSEFGTASGATLTRSDGVQYTLQATGDYVTVVVSGISAAAAELVPNYMPLAVYDSGTGSVSLLVTPETSGVAMEMLSDVMDNYVRRDGAGSPTFYDGAQVTLGTGATLKWNNNDGQILGVSLLRGNNLAIQQIDTLSFGTGTLSLSQPSAGQLEIAGAGGSLYVEGPKLSSSTGDLILESSTVIATGEKLYIGDKGGADTYSMSTANGELKMENSTGGYVSFKRTASDLIINTDADQIKLTKNLIVSRIQGTIDNADYATEASHATTANKADLATLAQEAQTLSGKTWDEIKTYINNNSGGNFQSDFSTPGYVKMPNGLIIQWGTGSCPPTGKPHSSTTVYFKIPFPHGCLSLSGVVRNGVTWDGYYAHIIAPNIYQYKDRAYIVIDTSGTNRIYKWVNFHWMAIVQ